MTRSTTYLLALLIYLVPCPLGAQQKQDKGVNCLFIGHSFFIPVARVFEGKAKLAGITKHKQQTVFAGGAKGSPGNLWRGPKQKQIQDMLRKGDVDLLGMTYHPEGSGVDDYKRWIDFALKHNPKTNFVIGLTWGIGGPSRNLLDFRMQNRMGHELLFAQLISVLRKAYPKNTITCMNYGPAADVLKELFENKKLPDAKAMVDREDGVFSDIFGHAGKITLDLSALVWLSVIYNVDLTQAKWKSKYKTDLRKLADTIAKDNAAHNTHVPARKP